MLLSRLLILPVMTTGLLAQSEGISVVVTRTADLAADEITFNLGVLTDADVTLDQVLEATKSLGLTASSLGGIGSQQFGPSPSQTRLVYQFAYTVPAARFRETNDRLAALRRTLAANTPSMELQTFAILVTPTDAAREQARQRSLQPLLTEARQRGQELAQASGLRLGRILGLNEILGGPSGYPIGGFYGPVAPSTLKATFGLAVRFAVE